MQARASRRVLIVVGILLVLVLVVADLERPHSIIRSTWYGLTQHETPLERMLRTFRGAERLHVPEHLTPFRTPGEPRAS